MESENELALRKNEINRELNDLTDIKSKARDAETGMQSDIAEDMQSLKTMEEMLGGDHIDVSEITEDIRQQLKQYDDYAEENTEDDFALLEKKIVQLEDELEGINRDNPSF